jgi:hypothetical protein
LDAYGAVRIQQGIKWIETLKISYLDKHAKDDIRTRHPILDGWM